jgi:hypothetical protein
MKAFPPLSEKFGLLSNTDISRTLIVEVKVKGRRLKQNVFLECGTLSFSEPAKHEAL